MNTFRNIRLVLLSALLLVVASCTDLFDPEQLNQAPAQELDYDNVFTDYENFRKFVDYTYAYIPGHLGRLWNSMVCELSDEADGPGVNTCSGVFNNGALSATPIPGLGTDPSANANREVFYVWEDCFSGIRHCNLILQNIEMINNFPSEEIKNRTLGEAYFIRAFLYFELTKRWGAVPIVDKALDLNNDDLDLARNTYDECIQFISDDCDRAAALLPLVQPDAETGRATKGAALALKSRTLLYAARPLHNPENDQGKWKAALQAAQAVIDLNIYALDPDYVNMFFRPDLGPEIIFNRPRKKINFEQGHTNNSNFLVRFIVPQGYLGWMGTCVTETFAEMYEADNGYPIYDSRSGFTEEMLKHTPYVHRDPRFKMTLLYNDRYWYNRNVEYYVGGKDYGSSLINPFGYSIAKFWPEWHQRYQGTTTYLNYIFFRYAEILLNYAEAANEVYGPDGIPTSGLSARQAANMVRARVNHVDIPMDISSNTADMRERLKNERAIELCFEEQRWYDVLSWKEGTKYFNGDIKAMKVIKEDDGTFTYEPFVYETRTFRDYMHLYPVPNSEIFKSDGRLLQNPGW